MLGGAEEADWRITPVLSGLFTAVLLSLCAGPGLSGLVRVAVIIEH